MKLCVNYSSIVTIIKTVVVCRFWFEDREPKLFVLLSNTMHWLGTSKVFYICGLVLCPIWAMPTSSSQVNNPKSIFVLICKMCQTWAGAGPADSKMFIVMCELSDWLDRQCNYTYQTMRAGYRLSNCHISESLYKRYFLPKLVKLADRQLWSEVLKCIIIATSSSSSSLTAAQSCSSSIIIGRTHLHHQRQMSIISHNIIQPVVIVNFKAKSNGTSRRLPQP